MSEAPSAVLVVDDEESVLRMLRILLTSAGFEVSCVEGSVAAHALLEAGRFEVLLTDKNLPDGDGLEIARSAHRRDPTMGIVVMTAFASQESAAIALEVGAVDFLEKPFKNLKDVQERVRAASASCRKRRATRGREQRSERLVALCGLPHEDEPLFVEAVRRCGGEPICLPDLAATGHLVDLEAAIFVLPDHEPSPANDPLRARQLPALAIVESLSFARLQAAIRWGARSCLPRDFLRLESLVKELGKLLGPRF